jgi:AraC-like DNA-binding protein
MKEFFETIFLLASIQGVLLSLVLLFRKENHAANIFLSLGILALSSELFADVYYSKGWYQTFIHFSGLTSPMPLTYGPLFYFYTKFLTKEHEKFSLKNLLHFLPFISAIIILSPVFFYPANEKLVFVQKAIAGNHPFVFDIIEIVIPIQGLIYTVLMIVLVLNYNKKIKESYSNIEKINLDWLKYLTFGMIFCWSTVALSKITGFFIDASLEFEIVLHTSISILIYSIGYMNLNQPEIFTKRCEEETNGNVQEKYKKSGLDSLTAEEIKNKLLGVMEKQKPHLDSDLTLLKLAEIVSVSGHHLSEVINSKLNKTYYDFINEYRVEEFKNKIKDPSTANYSLISIAFDSGFQSKTSFNTIFKKHTNQTPSEYKSSLKLQ